MIAAILLATWDMLIASASWLLAGLTIASLLHAFLPAKSVAKHLEQPGLRSVVKSSLFGIPLPLCSCSVIPVAMSLRKRGASKGATSSFLISTPEIGVDSFLLSYALLGPALAVWRVIAACAAAIAVGVTLDQTAESAPSESPAAPKSCCSSEPTSCCNSETSANESFAKKIFHSATTILDDIAVTLTIGFLLAGAISYAIPVSWVQSIGSTEIVSMLLMLVASAPLYICATSSTPIAAALIAKGLSPGAALVFLLAGPATNVTTMTFVLREFGIRSLIIYIAGIAGTALAAGLIVNRTLGDISTVVDASSAHHHHATIGETIAAAVLLGLLIISLYRVTRSTRGAHCEH